MIDHRRYLRFSHLVRVIYCFSPFPFLDLFIFPVLNLYLNFSLKYLYDVDFIGWISFMLHSQLLLRTVELHEWLRHLPDWNLAEFDLFYLVTYLTSHHYHLESYFLLHSAFIRQEDVVAYCKHQQVIAIVASLETAYSILWGAYANFYQLGLVMIALHF